MSLLAVAVPTFTDIVAPYLPFFGVVAGGTLVGIFTRWNSKRGNVESKTPTVQQIWDEQRQQKKDFDLAVAGVTGRLDGEVERRKKTERAFVGLRDVFLKFADRVQRGGSPELTIEEHAALELPVPVLEDDDLAGS